MSHMKILAGLLVVAGSCWADSALAQTRPNPCFANGPSGCQGGLSAIPFDILPPGARALGLGGAFAAVADDATAAEANPAGMTILSRPEVSLHGRHADYSTKFYDVNALDGLGFGATGPGAVSAYEDTNTRPSFASVVYPIGRFVVSAYYHNAGKLQSNSNILSFNSRFIDTYIASTLLDVEQDSIGLSGAFRVNDLLSIGASLKRTKLDLSYNSISTILDFSDNEFQFTNPTAAAAQINEIDAISLLAEGDDTDITYNLGLLLNPNGKVSAGLVYKEGGSFRVNSALNYVNIFDCNGLAGCTVPSANQVTNLSNTSSDISLPDILTLGIAVRPTDTVLLSLQFDRVDYGELPPASPQSLIFSQPGPIAELNAEVNVHAGAEKTFLFDQPILGMSLLSLRAGVFTDRDHDGYTTLNTNERHYTFGLGTVIGEDFQIDVASEWSKKIDNIVLSAVYRF